MAPDEFAQSRDDVADMDMNDPLTIDKATDKTSLVLQVTMQGKVSPLPSDAQRRKS
jgi:hypothetical protein